MTCPFNRDEGAQDRVPAHTSEPVQAAIDRRIEGAIHDYAQHPEEIGQRLREIDESATSSRLHP